MMVMGILGLVCLVLCSGAGFLVYRKMKKMEVGDVCQHG